jgi:serine/threonine-protein kinase
MSTEPSAPGNRQLQIGKYRVLTRIATGGMGAVYKALDTQLQREVALKVMAPEMATKPNLIERFRLEALFGGKLKHKNIVTLYESGQVNGIPYLALEFVEGIDLHEYVLQKGKVDVEESRKIILQATRAIAHLHEHGIVHRDIKPSNFLILHKNGRPRVKLIDLGLARNRNDDEECRVTRAGTTVGTVDYISPEQARNSGTADVRSDIYSLGCTWYHLLAGQPPFAEGSMAERVLKHIEVQPPDIRTLNATVPARMVEILSRMLAKDPTDRYQTPAALIRDLEETEEREEPIASDLLAGLAEDYGEPDDAEVQELPRASSRPKGKRSKAKRKNRTPVALMASIAFFLCTLLGVGAFGVWLIVRPSPTPPGQERREEQPEVPKQASQETTPAPPAAAPPVPVQPEPSPSPGAPTDPRPEPALPLLFKRGLSINAGDLQREFQGPWEKPVEPWPPGPTYKVQRSYTEKKANEFDSLAAACAAAPAGKETVIEIHANGPLFEVPAAVSGRSLVIRAGQGYRPLVAWDTKHPAAKAEQFLSVSGGNLRLENLDLVYQAVDKGQADSAALVRVTDGAITARGCAFSVAGKHAAGVAAIRLEKTQPDFKCTSRLSQCYLRGAEMVAVDLRAIGSEVLVENCLIVGGDRPLLAVRGSNPLVTSTLRVLRSTLVAGRTILQVRPASSSSTAPALRWLGWDSLLAHARVAGEGTMVVLEERTNPKEIQWQATNCLYAGWKRLLTGPGLTITDISEWRAQWHQTETDAALGQSWPGIAYAQAAEMPSAQFETRGTPAFFAATSHPGPLGSDLSALPPARGNWLALTYEPFVPALLEAGALAGAPLIPNFLDGRYHGGRLDLNQIPDLGKYLLDMERTRGLGPKVVLHLAGKGEHRTSPICLHGVHLVLYFEPAEEEASPLTLVADSASSGDREALVEVAGGSLQMIGGAMRFVDRKALPQPSHMIKISRGNLTLAGCSLEGPLTGPTDNYRSLIHFEGAGDANAGQPNACALMDSVLTSARAIVRVTDTGTRLAMNNCVLVATGNVLEFGPGESTNGQLKVQCTLDHNTIATKHALIHLRDRAKLAAPVEPIIVQARANVVMSPFAGTNFQAGLLQHEGEALNRGLLLWQGQGNLYDRRLQFFSLGGGETVPDRAQPHAVWTRLWGAAGDVNPFCEQVLPQILALDKPLLPQLYLLALPATFKAKPVPGADLAGLGLVKKKKKK